MNGGRRQAKASEEETAAAASAAPILIWLSEAVHCIQYTGSAAATSLHIGPRPPRPPLSDSWASTSDVERCSQSVEAMCNAEAGRNGFKLCRKSGCMHDNNTLHISVVLETSHGYCCVRSSVQPSGIFLMAGGNKPLLNTILLIAKRIEAS